MHHDRRIDHALKGRAAEAALRRMPPTDRDLLQRAEAGLVRGFGTAVAMPPDTLLAKLFGERWEELRERIRLAVIRNLLSESQNHRCCHCGRRTTLDGPLGLRPTIEHVIPKVRGGALAFGNCAMSCGDCNSKRNDAHIPEESLVDADARDPHIPFAECGPAWEAVQSRRRAVEAGVPDIVRSIPADADLDRLFGPDAPYALEVHERRLLATVLAERQHWRCAGCRLPIAERPFAIGADPIDDPRHGQGGASCPGCRSRLQADWLAARHGAVGRHRSSEGETRPMPGDPVMVSPHAPRRASSTLA